MNKNYLKGYPYLFVRESDQTDYFCTLCDAFLKEEELQAHLFDGHQAEDYSNYFVRVVVGLKPNSSANASSHEKTGQDPTSQHKK